MTYRGCKHTEIKNRHYIKLSKVAKRSVASLSPKGQISTDKEINKGIQENFVSSSVNSSITPESISINEKVNRLIETIAIKDKIIPIMKVYKYLYICIYVCMCLYINCHIIIF